MFANIARGLISTASRRPYICQRCLNRARRPQLGATRLLTQTTTRLLQTESLPPLSNDTPFRKVLKDAAKQQKKNKLKKSEARANSTRSQNAHSERWELTVGIEVHAELNTARKLFSEAATSIGESPNSHVALFDAALPGSQPHFQKETLIPAIRAAQAFHCQIMEKSSFDRKHYFYQDQPTGYQITQYYAPFAKHGMLLLYPHDFPPGAAPSQDVIKIDIKQIQMEQDTAKTLQQPPATHLLDFNRVSHPLIEIITLPQIHDPIVASAVVRKIQNKLKQVNACTTGMELGGLRADVNVSVRERHVKSPMNVHSYGRVKGLGQRTEIKNLASVRAIEDAIIAERDRQIAVLESGGVIKGETRGWAVGNKTTNRLRGKEGEIDYRYMPDPDIPPVYIARDLISHLHATLPKSSDVVLDRLVEKDGLTSKDATTLISLDTGARCDYFFAVKSSLGNSTIVNPHTWRKSGLGKLAGDWVIMELGSLIKDEPWNPLRVPPMFIAGIIERLHAKQITSRSAKRLLALKFEGDARSVEEIIENERMKIQEMPRVEYVELAQKLLDENPNVVRKIVEKKHVKKIMWFVGQMIARGRDGSVDPGTAEATLMELMTRNRP